MNLYERSAGNAFALASAAEGRAQAFVLTMLTTMASILIPVIVTVQLTVGVVMVVMCAAIVAAVYSRLRYKYRQHRRDYVRFLICAELQQIADETDCTISELDDETVFTVMDGIERRTKITFHELRMGVADIRDDLSFQASECGWISIESSAA